MNDFKASNQFWSESHREAGVNFNGKLINLPPIEREFGYTPVSKAEQEFLLRCAEAPTVHVTRNKPASKELDPVKLWESINGLTAELAEAREAVADLTAKLALKT